MIYCYSKHYSHYSFFKQLSAKVYKTAPLFFTDNIFLFLYLKLKGEKVKRVPVLFHNKGNLAFELSTREQRTIQWEMQYFKKKESQVQLKYVLLKQYFSRFAANEKEVIGFCWSGNNTESLAFSEGIRSQGGWVLHGEITNYPRTVYLDGLGTNYFSKMREELSSQTEKPSGDIVPIEQLKELKASQKKLPQSKITAKNKFFITCYGIQNYLLFNGKRFGVHYILAEKFKSVEQRTLALIQRGHLPDLKTFNLPESTGENVKILVPLQVNHDTQLHVFSRFTTIFEFVKTILELVDSRFEVHFKLHPAEMKENNLVLEKFLSEINQRYSFIGIVGNTDITSYDFIVTNNSTFGIDALLHDQKVICFGDSLYSDGQFVLNFSKNSFSSLREACESYDSLTNKEHFSTFAKEIQSYFFNFNYFTANIDEGISENLLEESIRSLRQKFPLPRNYK